MADPTNEWTIDALHTHLQYAIDLELWTLPLYICAVSSIKDQTKDPGKSAADLINSIVIQEMLHLELACNLALAFGMTPQFNQPVYSPQIGIPFHTPETQEPVNGPYEVRLGPLDENAINLFLEVELPKDLSEDKGKGTTGPADTYDSIGEFYQALQEGVKELWQTCNKPDYYKCQKLVFAEPNPVPNPLPKGDYPSLDIKVTSYDEAVQAIATIVDQGEGSEPQGGVLPVYQPTVGQNDPLDALDTLSHYERFLKVKSQLPIEIYTDKGSFAGPQQLDLDMAFGALLQDLSDSFSSEGIDLVQDAYTKMFAIPGLATKVWHAGACPEFRAVPARPTSL
ncbi:MAG TPA: ferritin-like protein [Chloroflexia bacterium]|nr:ferritin-like protein [Chloroflexia bacterium]